MNSNSSLRSSFNTIKNDVNDLLKKIETPNDRLFERSIATEIRIPGYHDPANLYRTNVLEESEKVKKNNQIITEQNRRMGVQENVRVPSQPGDIKYAYDNRKQGFPSADINEYNDVRKAYVDNNGGKPFMNASQRNTQLVEDTLLDLNERRELRNNKERPRSVEKSKSVEKSNDKNSRSPKDRDNRYNYYPDQGSSTSYSTVGQKKDSNFKNPNDPKQINKTSRNPTGDVFTHNKERDRVPINPKNLYRGSEYESTPYNALDEEVTYDRRKKAINAGQINYPTGDVFTHNAQKDRVPIDPTVLYRNSDYESNPYAPTDLQVDTIPRTAKVSGTADYMLNREFDIVDNNQTSKDEQSEKTMIHTPYTTLDKFDKPAVVFKNINMEKPQIDVLNEFIINLDTSDRNTEYYPNPFKLRVLFNPGNDTNADLKIPRAFENIKYLRLETATLPRYYLLKNNIITNIATDTLYLCGSSERDAVADILDYINTEATASTLTYDSFREYVNTYNVVSTAPAVYSSQFVDCIINEGVNINVKFNISINDSTIYSSAFSTTYEVNYNIVTSTTDINRYVIDFTKDLSKDRYTMINLEEITDNTQNSTSGKSQYNYLYPDYITDKYFYGDNHFVDKIFKNAKLGELKTLTITLSDSFGNPIKGGKYIDTVSSTKDKLSTTDEPTNKTVYNDSVSYIRHPYYREFQITLMFKVGCYETEIDKKIFY
jgi:hypothetical protein